MRGVARSVARPADSRADPALAARARASAAAAPRDLLLHDMDASAAEPTPFDSQPAQAFVGNPLALGADDGGPGLHDARSRGAAVDGMGAGGRHGMSSGAVRGLGRKVKPLKLQNGDTVYVDILCNNCGYEQPPHHRRLRCDSCGMPLALLDMADLCVRTDTKAAPRPKL